LSKVEVVRVSKFLVIDLETQTEYVTEGLVLTEPVEPVLTAVTGECCPLVRCPFGPTHTPHYYRDDDRKAEGRCNGQGC
jgi:hypothetical protein